MERGTSKKNTETCPRCKEDFTADILKKVYKNASTTHLVELAAALNKYKDIFMLNTCARKAHFFAQSLQEASLNLTPGLDGESLNYSVDGLLTGDLGAFTKSEQGRQKAKDLGRKSGEPKLSQERQRQIANWAYGIQYKTGKELKNTGGDDGWNFRGRRLLQITGRGNYNEIQEIINRYAPYSGVIADVGGRSYTPKEAAVTGMADWFMGKMYVQADQTGKLSDDQVVLNIIDIINRKTSSKEERKVWYRGGTAGNLTVKETYSMKMVFHVSECGKTEESLKFIDGRAPWIPFAMEELKKYGGIRQIHSPLKEKVVEYFKVSKADWYDHTGYWCGAFVRWCFAQTEDYNYVFDSYNSVTVFNWLSSEHTTNKGTRSKRTKDVEAIIDLKDVFVGAIIVFDYSHVAFVVGQSTDGNSILYLGGNQSDKAPGDGAGKRTICIGKISKTKFNTNFWLSKPKKYEPTEKEKQLPKLKISAYELDYSSTR